MDTDSNFRAGAMFEMFGLQTTCRVHIHCRNLGTLTATFRNSEFYIQNVFICSVGILA
jgi:hypothetical protein